MTKKSMTQESWTQEKRSVVAGDMILGLGEVGGGAQKVYKLAVVK